MNISNLNHHQIIFQARVENSEDPAMLGRIRAVLITNEDQSAISSGTDWNPEKDKTKPKGGKKRNFNKKPQQSGITKPVKNV